MRANLKLSLSLPLVIVMILATTACGAQSEEEQIASDACNLLAQVADEGFEAIMEMAEEMEELEQRAEAAGLSEADVQEAIQNECPDVFEDLGGMDF